MGDWNGVAMIRGGGIKTGREDGGDMERCIRVLGLWSIMGGEVAADCMDGMARF